MDFTFTTYTELLKTLKANGYSFITAKQYFKGSLPNKFVILRNDVEKHYLNALRFSEIQSSLNIDASYFFRINKKYYKPDIINLITANGNELGYHYDDLVACKGNYEQAIKRFQKNITELRKYSDLSTISMEGAPLSKFANKLLWEKYNFKDYGINADISADIDFEKIFYLTETGRRWNGYKVSVRDKVVEQQNKWNEQGYNYRSTFDIIKAVENNTFPDKVLMTFHPQRWNDKLLPWLYELIFQNIKNSIKWALIKYTKWK